MTPEREEEIRAVSSGTHLSWPGEMMRELLAEIDRLKNELSITEIHPNQKAYDLAIESRDKFWKERDDLRDKLAVGVDALEFYTLSPYYFPDGFYELNIKQSEGGHVRFGTKAREALSKIKGEK